MRLAAAALVAALVTPALADSDRGSDDDATGSTARPLRVRVELAGAIATIHLSVLLDLDGDGTRNVPLELPPRASVVSGTVRSGKTTHPLALTDADRAADRFDQLASAPPAHAMATAITIDQPESGPVEINALAPGRTQMVLELELESPTCFLGDRRHLAIPASWADVLSADLRRRVIGDDEADVLEPDGVDARCSADGGWSDDVTTWLALPTTELARKRAGDDRIGTSAGRFAHGATEAAKVELALAGTMSAVPADLATAFVVDGSRSLDAGMIETERAVIASYLRHAPRTAVQVIAFDRAGHALLPKWATAAGAAAAIDRELAQLIPRNGSDLDAGLAEAGRWLERRTGTRRVVVFTDELFPERLGLLDPVRLAQALPAGTVVQVVSIASGDGALVRDDDAALAPLAAATAGIAMSTTGSEGLDAVALVRPVSLDHVRITAPGFTALDAGAIAGTGCVVPGNDVTAIDLAEGSACTWWALGPSTTESVTVEGLVWGRRWRQVVDLGARDGVQVARELWSVIDKDRDPELLDAAERAARTVNTRWSLAATWGGDGGYGDQFDDLSGSFSGCGCGNSSNDIGIGIGHAFVVHHKPMADQVEAAIGSCRTDAGARGATVDLAIETTRDEIVGVAATIGGITGEAATRLAACVEASVWDLELGLDKPPEHQHWQLAYR